MVYSRRVKDSGKAFCVEDLDQRLRRGKSTSQLGPLIFAYMSIKSLALCQSGPYSLIIAELSSLQIGSLTRSDEIRKD